MSTQDPCSALQLGCEIYGPALGFCRAGTCVIFSMMLFSCQWCRTDNLCVLYPPPSARLLVGWIWVLPAGWISRSLLLHGEQEAGAWSWGRVVSPDQARTAARTGALSCLCFCLCVIACLQGQRGRASAQGACPSPSRALFFTFAGLGYSKPAESEHDPST